MSLTLTSPAAATTSPATAVVDPGAGGRLASLVVAGHELMAASGRPEDPPSVASGCFPMVPWANRIGGAELVRGDRTYRLPPDADGNALHGLGLDRPWSVTARDGASCVLACEIGDPWPGRGTARLSYALDPGGITMELAWDGDEASHPVSLGLHPWFPRSLGGASARLDIPARTMVERRDDLLPTGRLVPPRPGPWNDCFGDLAADPTVEWPGVLTLTVSTSASWYVVFDELPAAVCVEPQTAPPDPFRHPALQPDPWPVAVSARLAWEVHRPA